MPDFNKLLRDERNTQDIKPTNHDLHYYQNAQPNDAAETPVHDSGSISVSSNDNRKVSRDDIELVQNLIERCLQLYMNKDEVVNTLLNRARIDPGFTTLVWQKLEEENADFFRAYYIRLKLKKQIILFNHLLEHQYNVMKYPVPPKVPLAPMQNGFHTMPVDNLPMGYPVLQHPPVHATMRPHIDHMGYSTSSCHVVNGVPAPGNFHPMQMNSGNDTVIEPATVEISPVMPANNAISCMPVSPTSVASSGLFPFSTSEMSGMGVDTSALDPTFTSDVALDNNSRDPLIPWNVCFSDLTGDLSNLGDLGALGNYPGSPFLSSDSDILLNSPEQKHIGKKQVEEFFVDSDSVPGPYPPSDREKS
ncbi:hypothetical protein BUALT_Bualt19G0003700 [Buddleja alternifolia]|uniref:Angiotensin-converting enzyme 2 n=1 Tax=Buddleja alternifolia TaxID=168488 RepID=A0AAV6W463_9LAMI|nr:hypothetical protein BUALT_Bualt19G0003700 [Buddleja alternifolia]